MILQPISEFISVLFVADIIVHFKVLSASGEIPGRFADIDGFASTAC